MKLNRFSALALLVASALTVPALAADTATIKGVVYDANSKPVAKATVSLFHRDKSTKKLEEVDRATTDADGVFSLGKVADGTYLIVAANRSRELRDRSEITIHDGKNPADLSFTLRPGKEPPEVASAKKQEKAQYVNFVGQVVDKNGDAVVGATVKLLTGDNDAKTDKLVTVDSVESEKKGRFEFYKVRFGHYIIEATKNGKTDRQEVTLKDEDGTQSVQLKLR
ncbi:MAG: carboxypeptidase-like regulatory domain-containing protein [Tepidisphaeraceae bacterium]